MVSVINHWFQRYFSNSEVIILWLLIVFITALFILFGKILAPVLASIALAYLLQGFIGRLEKHRVPHVLAVMLVYVAFLGLVIVGLLGLLPLLWRQLSNLINEVPNTLGKGQAMLMAL